MALGSIVIDLLLKTGAFETDTARAAKRIRDLQKTATQFGTAFKASFAGNLVAGAVSAVVSEIARIPAALTEMGRAAGNFKDIEDRIGAAAEEFAGFQVAADTAGLSIQSLEGFSVRLTKALSKIDDESKGVGAALAAIGIPLEEFKRLDPVKQIERLSTALSGFKAGAGQTAVLEALVKGGSEVLPFLKELEAQGGRTNILTREQILLADEFSDKQARATAELKAFIQQGLIAALPALTALTQGLGDAVKAMLGVNNAASQLETQQAIGRFADGAAIFLARLIDLARITAKAFQFLVETIGATAAIAATLADGSAAATKAAFSFDPKGLLGVVNSQASQIGAIVKSARENGQREIAAFELFADQVQKRIDSRVLTGKRLDASTDPRSTTFGKGLPTIDTRGLIKDDASAAKKDGTAKKLLDQQLKDLENALGREKDLLASRNKYLDIFNSQGLLSINDFYESQIAIIEASTAKQAALIDRQIKAIQGTKAATPEDRISNETKINDLIDKRAKLFEDVAVQVDILGIKQREEQKKFADEIKGLNADVLELKGNLGAAAAIRFDLQNAQFQRTAIAEGNQAALDLLDTLKRNTVAQGEFNEAVKANDRITESLRLQEERIAVSRKLGAITELEALKRIGEERQKALVQQQAEVAILEAKARANPENKGFADQAARARSELEQLAAVADPLGDKFRSIFEESASGPLEGFIAGTKTAKEAFGEFVSSVLAGITRLVAQNIAQSLFGSTSGAGGGIGEFFGAIFGGARAQGGDVIAGRDYWVGEQGPERFRPRVNGTIVPSEESTMRGSRGDVRVNANFTLQAPVNRQTEQQIAAAVGRGVQRSGRIS